tara:strand:+ start:418 stop:792 length:375 start_codon:yes stop_codon:yes gene_type:complete
MRKIIFILSCIILFSSCKKDKKLDVKTFRTGTFEIPATDEYSKTIIKRIDSLQIEIYEGKVDTLLIRWKNDFNYTLKMLNMMNGMEEDPIHVQITRLNSDSYEFTAIIGHSNFKQDGKVFKISE